MTNLSFTGKQIKALIGTSFGHFNESNQALAKKYNVIIQYDMDSTSYKHEYKDNNGNLVASAEFDSHTNSYTIFDHGTKMTYVSEASSEVAPKKQADKFNSIYVGDWVISDSNKNGIVDESDAMAWVGKGLGPISTIGDFMRKGDLSW